ncbi:MAG: phosphoribosylglycinamide formyltransferase [Deltaproteobacteria bacterium]|nr:phosphoribosylglycinamide formyltransferase [Deltaproteobacteria bacterium]
MTPPLQLGILLSGRGSNMQAIHQSITKGKLHAQIKIILSDQPQAGGLAYAKTHGLAHQSIPKIKGESLEDYEKKLLQVLQKAQVDTIVLAGFMRLLSPYFLKHYPDRVLNIHPSLLPNFPGLAAQKQALEAGASESGCTVHFVDEGCDTGPIIDQRRVSVLSTDTVESLSERILKEEHVLYSQVLEKLAQGKIQKKGKQVLVKD